MKRSCTASFLAIAFLLYAPVLVFAQSRSVVPADTMRYRQERTPTFGEIEGYFREYWSNRDSTKKGMGWKPYKRWQWFWSQRLAPTDTMPAATLLYDEWQKEQRRVQEQQFQEQGGGKRGREKTYAAAWTLIGPDTIPLDNPAARQFNSGVGRINCVRFQPGSPNIVWVGTGGGGAWRSPDAGVTWQNRTANLPVLGVSDIAIDPVTNANVYIATGDADGMTAPWLSYPVYTVGVMKSTNAGVTWSATGLLWNAGNTTLIHRLVMHPVTTAILIAATSNGLWRTRDHGATWNPVGPAGRRFTDLEFKPDNPNTIYAATFASNPFAAQVYISNDAGETWTPVTDLTLPGAGDPNTGRIALAVTPATSGTVFALYTNSAQGFRALYRSTTAGITWTLQSGTPATTNILSHTIASIPGGQGFYDLALAVSSTNPNCVVAGGINVWHSTTAGTSWVIKSHWRGLAGVPYMHGDHHDIVFPPGDGSTVYVGNDGGLWRSTNATISHDYAVVRWEDNLNNGLSIMQFYRLGCSATSANLLVGGAQDNGTNVCTNGTVRHWIHGIGGDGMECAVDQTNASIVYGCREHGALYRSNDGGRTFTQKIADNQVSAWVTPYVLHATTAQVVFIGFTTQLSRSPDHGDTYAAVPGVFPSVITSLAQSPSHPDIMYGASATSIQRTTTCNVTAGVSNWQNLTAALAAAAGGPLPVITSIAVADNDPDKVWVTLSGYTANRKVFYSEDGGGSWQNYSAGLPNLPVNCITYQKRSPDLVYAGTDLGVYYRHANMKQWEPYKTGLPEVVVTELEVQQSAQKLRAATYGRGIWQSGLADLPPLMLLKPNGGEIWVNGTTNTIRWFAQSTVGNVKLEYSLTSGASWTTISASTSATTGTYTWLTPDIWSTRALIRITSTTPAFSDQSDSLFTILPAIRVVAPNGGERIPIASTTAIRWAIHPKVAVTSLTIQCRLSTTAAWTTVATVPVAGTTGSYTWRTPVQTSTQASVRIVFITTATTTSAGVTTAVIADASDSVFALVHPLRVLAPNGGERIGVTSATGIRWELHTQATVTSLTFQYRLAPADAWVTIATVPVAPGVTTGTQPWTTPTTATAQARVRVLYVTTGTYVTSSSTTVATTTATIEDISDNDFSLVKLLALLFPNGGQVFPIGTTTAILWDITTNANVGVTQVTIEYSVNAGAAWTTLVASTPAAAKSYPWMIPNAATTQALVRITCTTNASWTDTSDNTFAISTTATCDNMAVNLDGSNDFLDASGLSSPSALTLEAWVVPHGVSSALQGGNVSEQYILFRRNSRTGAGNEAVAIVFDEDDNLFKAVATSAAGTRTVVSSPVGSADLYKPAHVALAFNGSELALYLNGRLQGRKTTGSAIDYSGSVLSFGRTGDSTNDGYFNGIIDEVRFWNTARSESDIYGAMYQRHIEPTAALAGYWHFDDATSTVAPDASGGGHPAVLYNGVQVVAFPDSIARFTWHIEGAGLIVSPNSAGTYSVPAVPGTLYLWNVQNGSITSGQGTNQIAVEWNTDGASSGRVEITATPLLTCATYAEITIVFVGCSNYALSFDGWNDEVEIADSRLLPGSAFTLEAWVHPSSTSDSSMRSILGSRQLLAVERPPILAVQGAAVVVGFGDGSAWSSATTGPVLTAGVWQHVAAAFDGTVLKVFVDGEERYSTSALSGLTPFPAPIGYIGSGEGVFSGMLDEVRIWNSARSQSDIQKAMYCRFATAQSGMLGYWKFDEYTYWWGYRAADIAQYNDAGIYGAWRTSVSLPSPPITGPDTVQADSSYVYCVPESVCDTYVWSVYGGTITAGQDTRCVTVEWGSGSYGMLSVSTQGENSCGSSYYSMAVVIVPPPIIVVHPDSGDTVVGDMMATVMWSQSYVATTSTVSIELSTDGGVSWSLVAGAVPSYSGTNLYSWTPPAAAVPAAFIRVADTGNPSVGDSGGPFEIVPPALEPPPAVAIAAGDGVITLSWMPSPSPGVVGYNIYVRPEYSGSFALLATVGAGTTVLTDSSVVNGTRYFYAVTAIDGAGESAFSVVVDAVPTGSMLMLVSPNGGEMLMAGTQVSVNWKPSSPQDTSVLEFSCNNGVNWYPIATVFGSTSYMWTVPYSTTAYGRIRVRNLSGSVSDASDMPFVIRSGYETAVNVRLFLEGAYTGMSAMSTDLQILGHLPFSQPYMASPFNYFGAEVRGSCVVDPVVDWVLVDIRSAMNPAMSVGRTAALLRSDGVLLDESGYPEVLLNIPPGMYYIAIAHRNHLEVMSAMPVYLGTGSSAQYSFTTSQSQAYQVFMPTLKQVDPGVFALVAGEALHDDVINADDRVSIINAMGAVGYTSGDVSLSGVVTALDRVLAESNQFMISQVP